MIRMFKPAPMIWLSFLKYVIQIIFFWTKPLGNKKCRVFHRNAKYSDLARPTINISETRQHYHLWKARQLNLQLRETTWLLNRISKLTVANKITHYNNYYVCKSMWMYEYNYGDEASHQITTLKKLYLIEYMTNPLQYVFNSS